jgi:hypothetical protein
MLDCFKKGGLTSPIFGPVIASIIFFNTSSAPAQASVVTFNFAGTWDKSYAGDLYFPAVPIGGIFTGSIEYDDSTPGNLTALGYHYQGTGNLNLSWSGGIANINTIDQSGSVIFSGVVAGQPWESSSGTIDTNFSVTIGFQFVKFLFSDPPTTQSGSINPILPLVFDTAASFVLATFVWTDAQGNTAQFYEQGHLTSFSEAPSSVPLPAALPLLAAGLGAMGFMGWRRKRKAAA